MAGVAWSARDGCACIRVSGLPAGARVEVRPIGPAVAHHLPAMAGELHRARDEACFVPRFNFLPGTSYFVTVDGVPCGTLVCPSRKSLPTAEVVGIYPSVPEVPRNLLRCYVWFSAPMAGGDARRCIALTGADGHPLAGALFDGPELWDARRQRLTVLLDPARIKRGLVPHRQAGYPLKKGSAIRLVVDPGFRDATGTPLRRGASRRYAVGGDERRLVDPGRWAVAVPAPGTTGALRVVFDRPLDHGLALRCLEVVDPAGRPISGTVAIGPQEQSWSLTPDRPWVPGSHRLVVDPVLEDLAGNSVRRVFDRDLDEAAGLADPAPPTVISFCL